MTDTPDNQPKPVEMYRVRLGVSSTSSSSTGRTDYYESREYMLTDLLAAQLDVLLDRANSARDDQNVRRRRRIWRDFLKGDDYPKINQIVAVEQLVDDHWAPLELTFTEPTVTAELVR